MPDTWFGYLPDDIYNWRPPGATTPGGTTTSTGGLTGSTPQPGAGAYGQVPTVPSPQSTQQTAVTGNLLNIPGLFDLAKNTNAFNQAQLTGAYEGALPGYGALTTQASKNIGANLQGVLAPDVIRQMQQRAAERGVATGTSGSANESAAYLRALGLTSLDLQNLGQTQLTGAIGRTPIAQLFNPATMYVTPEQQFNAQALANLYAAAPNPSAAAAAAIAAAKSGMAYGGGGGGVARTTGAPSAATGTGGGLDLVNSMLQRYGGYGGGGATGTTIGGVNYRPGETPESVSTNWRNWIAGLNQGEGGGGMSDLYYNYGLSPEDLSGLGLGLEDLFSWTQAGGEETPLDPGYYGYEGAG